MKRIIFIIVLMCVLVGCGLFDKDDRPLWTMFVYMAADNNLYDFAIADIIEMQRGLLNNNNVRIIVYIDHCGISTNGRVEYLEISPSDRDVVSSRVLRRHGDEDSGSGETLLKFMNWAYSRYASERNVLVIWSHGDGWVRSGNAMLGIGQDDTSGNMIGVSSGEFRNAFFWHNKRYDIIILDACEMGSLEVVTELEGYADFVIASMDRLNANGFPWSTIIETWGASVSARELARLIVSHTANAYRMGGIYNNSGFVTRDKKLSLSVYSMSKLDSLIEAIQEFSTTFANPDYSDYFANIRGVVFHLSGFASANNDVDFYDFVRLVRDENSFTAEQKAVIETLWYALDDFIVYNETLDSLNKMMISIMYPKYYQDFVGLNEKHWSNLRLSRSDWDVFLSSVYGDK